MIQSVPYSFFDLSELLTLSDQSYQLVTERHPEQELLAKVLQALSDAMERARLALGSTTKEALTEQVQLLDAKRDDNYNGLITYMQSGLKRTSRPDYQEASGRLIALINQHGGRSVYQLSYSKQTAAMESLFKDFASAEAQADLATINALKWLKELEADHEAFKILYAQREKQRANKDIPTDEGARKQLKSALGNLYNVINAFVISVQIEGLEETTEILNKSIDRALKSARRYAGKAEPQAPASEDSDVPE